MTEVNLFSGHNVPEEFFESPFMSSGKLVRNAIAGVLARALYAVCRDGTAGRRVVG